MVTLLGPQFKLIRERAHMTSCPEQSKKMLDKCLILLVVPFSPLISQLLLVLSTFGMFLFFLVLLHGCLGECPVFDRLRCLGDTDWVLPLTN